MSCRSLGCSNATLQLPAQLVVPEVTDRVPAHLREQLLIRGSFAVSRRCDLLVFGDALNVPEYG